MINSTPNSTGASPKVDALQPEDSNAAKTGSADDHPENQEGAAKATQDNDLTTGHSRDGDGGDDNSKRKSR